MDSSMPSHQAGTDGVCVALRPDPGFQGNPSIYPALAVRLLMVSIQPHVPTPFRPSLRAASTIATTSPVQPTVFPS